MRKGKQDKVKTEPRMEPPGPNPLRLDNDLDKVLTKVAQASTTVERDWDEGLDCLISLFLNHPRDLVCQSILNIHPLPLGLKSHIRSPQRDIVNIKNAPTDHPSGAGTPSQVRTHLGLS